MRYAASRSGVSHATWSRIERGRQSADNRFVLAAIAAALECPPADLTATPAPVADREVVSAQACVPSIRQALIELDLQNRATQRAQPPADLLRAAALVRHLWQKCDYAGTSRLLPDLIRGLGAADPHDPTVLHLLCDITGVASSALRNVGHPADSWLAAERCRTVAEATDDPVLLGYAAFAQAMAARICGSQTRCLTIAERAADDLQSHLDRSGAMDVLGMLHLIRAAAANRLDRPDDTATSIAQATDIARRTSDTAFLGMHFGPPNVHFWQVGIDADNGDPGHAIARAQSINPAVIKAPQRQVYFYLDVARACSRIPGTERQALRYLLSAERIAPQHVHSSEQAREITRTVIEHSDRPQHQPDPSLRGLSERLGFT